MEYMSSAKFDRHAKGYCYKCRRGCNLYGPDGIPPNMLNLVIAGTTCTSWSRVGARRRWAAAS
eukprot:4632645-Lingulodinium_polyedra.AAC.1